MPWEPVESRVTGNTSLLRVNQGVTINNAILLIQGDRSIMPVEWLIRWQGCWAALGAGT